MALNMRDSLAKTCFLRRALAVLSFSLTFALAGCDSFSLLDMLGPLKLTAATTKVARNGDPVALNVSGGTPPYSFSVTAVDLYAGTSLESIGGVDNQIYTSGGAIGRIEVKVIDAMGDEAKVTMFVVPRTPTLSLSSWVPKTGVSINWGYGDDRGVIDGFEIWRGENGGTITYWDDFNPNDSATSDNYLNVTASIFTYRIYAVAGEYRSIPDEDSR
jgi:hypothetical protein